MGKRKEIKFLCKDGQTREGRQDGVMFWIRKDQKREQVGLPAFYVAANDIKGKGRTIYTAGHEYFTLEGAKELCQQIMAGEANLAERKARYAAEDAEKAVRAAAEILGLDADLMIAEAEGLARATTFSNVEALYFVADQAASGKREVNGNA